jgi:undecaprenyl diphosphate synthase
MQQRTSPGARVRGPHVAIIMDGNGRWAAARGWPRLAGHREGAEAVRRTVEAARRFGVGTLTLYAFSSDNWRRPAEETSALMGLFEEHLKAQTAKCVERGIRLNVIGRRDRLTRPLAAAVEAAEKATAQGAALDLRIAVDYSARDAILRAAELLRGAGTLVSRERFGELVAEVDHSATPAREVDLLIRTGGEQRLSDFLLWECAYAELLFLPTMWPDFAAENLEAALREFHSRNRRFGGLPAASLPVAAA